MDNPAGLLTAILVILLVMVLSIVYLESGDYEI